MQHQMPTWPDQSLNMGNAHYDHFLQFNAASALKEQVMVQLYTVALIWFGGGGVKI